MPIWKKCIDMKIIVIYLVYIGLSSLLSICLYVCSLFIYLSFFFNSLFLFSILFSCYSGRIFRCASLD